MRLALIRRLWREALLLLLLGTTLGLPSTVVPGLQDAAFSQPFVIAGVAAGVKGLLNTALAPVVGVLADRTGRKALLLASLAILLAPFAAIEVAASQSCAGCPAVIIAFTIVDALLGLGSLSMSLCFAMVPERLGVEERALTAGYSLCNLALSSGVGVGAVLGALSDFRSCGRCGLVAAGANLAAAALLMPSSERRAGADEGWRRDAAALLRGNSTLGLLAAIVFLDFLAEQMLVSLLLLYLESRFHLGSLQLGGQLLVVGLCASLSLLFVVPRLQPLLGDLRLMQLGMIANVISVGLFAFIWRPWQALVPPLGCLISFAVFPTANTLAAVAVPRTRGGMAQGIVSGARTLAEGVSPVIFGWLFQVAAGSWLPGWPFLAAAGCVGVALAVSYRIPHLTVGGACEAAGGGISDGRLLVCMQPK